MPRASVPWMPPNLPACEQWPASQNHMYHYTTYWAAGKARLLAFIFLGILTSLVTIYVAVLGNIRFLHLPHVHGKVPNFRSHHDAERPRAALISLVRNSELSGIQQSIRQLEFRFNSNASHQYPWVFFNDMPFTQEFIDGTLNLTSGGAYYEVIPKEHWELPAWVDQERFMNSLEYLGSIGVGKGWLVSYRHMCRWNSGFFFQHPRLLEFDYYWRVEPNVHYFCQINYDVFEFIKTNGIKYGFTMDILDDARSFPSLWRVTQEFMKKYPDSLHPAAELDWVLSDTHAYASGHLGDIGERSEPSWIERDYNGCQFFSNFEIGDLNFFRSEGYKRYFDYLDKKGGYFYERWGDAPVHTIAVAMMLSPNETYWFRDIGYQHDVNTHCPPQSSEACSCEPTDIDSGFYKLVPLESPQKRPKESCIKMWLRSQK